MENNNLVSDEALVSVIMPCRDSEGFIRHAIRSVLDQSYSNIQLIIVDDGSEDSTVDLVQQFVGQDKRVTLLKRDKSSGGPAIPRNQGLKMVKGDYVAFIDSDDVWHEHKVFSQLSAMREYNLNFCSTLYTDFNGEDCPESVSIKTSVEIKPITHDQLLRKNIIATSSVLMTRELAQNLRFEEGGKYVAVEDYLAWLYLHQFSSIRSAVLLDELVFYRLRVESISRSKLVMAKKVFDLLSDYRLEGRTLGTAKYFYFAQYMIIGCYVSFTRWFRRTLRR